MKPQVLQEMVARAICRRRVDGHRLEFEVLEAKPQAEVSEFSGQALVPGFRRDQHPDFGKAIAAPRPPGLDPRQRLSGSLRLAKVAEAHAGLPRGKRVIDEQLGLQRNLWLAPKDVLVEARIARPIPDQVRMPILNWNQAQAGGFIGKLEIEAQVATETERA